MTILLTLYFAFFNFCTINNFFKWSISSISGGLASCVSSFCLYPLDNIKTRFQVIQKHLVESKKKDDKQTNTDSKIEEINIEDLTYISTVKKVFKTEGIKGFYKGISACLLANFISYGCYFFWYEFFKILFEEYSQYYGFITLTSMLAGLVATSFVNLFWVINARMAISKTSDGFLQTFFNGIKQEGIDILWKGVLPSYILVINPIIQFTIYENMKHSFESSHYQAIIVFLSGTISKIIASFATYPYQVIRTNMHVSKEKIGLVEVLKNIYISRGFMGFYKGHTAKLSQTALNSGIMLLVYEQIKGLTKKLLEIVFNQK